MGALDGEEGVGRWGAVDGEEEWVDGGSRCRMDA